MADSEVRFCDYVPMDCMRLMLDSAKEHRKVCGNKKVKITSSYAWCERCGWLYVTPVISEMVVEDE